MKLVLIRHGESLWNRENRFTGWTDVDLSPEGEKEAAEAGKLLLENGFDFDLCYTSYLKHAIRTLNLILQQMDREWLPVIKSWKLNERHYGALQGLNKAETAGKYGEAQVKIWRRSFDIQPPPLSRDDERNPRFFRAYADVNPDTLPTAESLKDTIARTVPYFETVIKREMLSGKRVIIAAHGNSLRALVKYFDNIPDDAIAEVNIPTGIPLVYDFDSLFRVVGRQYLGDAEQIRQKTNSVAAQGKSKK